MKIPSGETPHHIRKFMMIKTDFVLIFEKQRSWIIFILIKLIYYMSTLSENREDSLRLYFTVIQ